MSKTDEEESYFVSTPGKVILFGEHAVVYGKTAIAASLGLHTYAWLKTRKNGLVILQFPDVGLHHSWKVSEILSAVSVDESVQDTPIPLSLTVSSSLNSLMVDLPSTITSNAKQAALSFLYLFSRIYSKSKSIEVIVRSSLPIGAGLGSSASYSVSVVTGLLLASHTINPISTTNPTFSHEELAMINNWSFISEKVLHGNPSGIDNSLCTFGGAQLFAKGQLELLQGFTSLRFLLIDTRFQRDTKNQVEKFRVRMENYPAIINPLMDAVQGITESCRAAFSRPLSRSTIISIMETLMDMNHGLMVAAGVSHSSLEIVRRITASYGLVSKLTGSGGGGCAICLIKDDTTSLTIRDVQHSLRKEGMQCFQTTVGGSGVRGLLLTNDDSISSQIGFGFNQFALMSDINWSQLELLFPSADSC